MNIKVVLYLIGIGLILWLLCGCAGMQYYDCAYRYNYYEKRWEFAQPKDNLEFNTYEKEWQYRKQNN